MGSRIVTASKAKSICGISFKNYGSSHEDYPHLPYMTAACAIGLTQKEIDWFIARLDDVLAEFHKQKN